ncbi:MAG TPA: GH92 family glycosyl hydrolase [Balneolales bacterium]|nr:GH92 family glycosyl hydrolase [Balneolales bacterium]
MHKILNKTLIPLILLLLTYNLLIAKGVFAESSGNSAKSEYSSKKDQKHKQKHYPDLLKYVNTLQGTNSKFSHSHGNDYPAVALPRAMNFWSPQTGKDGNGWKYQYHAKTIRGFDETHQCSPWTNDYGVFTLMPITGKLVVEGKNRAAAFRHSREIAKPNYYKVTFDNGITTELAPTERGALFHFSFPQRKKSYLILDGYTHFSRVEIYPKKREIVGYVHNGHAIPKNFKNYFVLKFNQPFVSYGTWQNKTGKISKTNTSDEGNGMGAYIQFRKGARVQVKVASSYIGINQARLTLDQELGDIKNINQAKNNAAVIWNKLLNRIRVEGGTQAQKETFYSCLYRANLFPNKFYEIDKNGQPYYYSPNNGKIYKGYLYTDTGFWDTFRTQFPLYDILHPTFEGRFAKSILSVYKHNGWLPEWPDPGITGGGMIGNHVMSVLTDAWAKGLHTFNPDTALKAYFHEATNSKGSFGRPDWKDYYTLGYVPYPQNGKKTLKSSARTMAYSYDDFCGYQLAKMTHNKFYERIFAKQMYNYRNVIDTVDNFARGKDSMGNWDKHFNPYEWGGAFVEGASWQWTWAVFQDVQGLINLMGGDHVFASKLDSVFTVPDSAAAGTYGYTIHEMREMETANMGQYDQGNQPSFHMCYLYDYAGEPWKTQKHIRKAMNTFFNAGPSGFPGDEDEGSMSSWYVLSALGLYDVTPGTNQYVIGSPLFKKAIITMENGKKFIIKAENNSKSDIYIQSAKLNGISYQHNWITYKDIINGGELDYKMSNHPNYQRGVKKDDRPFSLSKPK